MSPTIEPTAGSLCGRIMDQVDIVVAELSVFDGRVVNGYGEFVDRSLAASALARARLALDAADKLFAEARLLSWMQDDPDAE